MRGDAEQQTEMLLALTPDQLVPDDHPIRRMKPVVERVLTRLSLKRYLARAVFRLWTECAQAESLGELQLSA
jgi:hypothetical protein